MESSKTECWPLRVGGETAGPRIPQTVIPVTFFSGDIWKRKSTNPSPSPWQHSRGRLKLSLTRSQRWWWWRPSWTWRRGGPSWWPVRASSLRGDRLTDWYNKICDISWSKHTTSYEIQFILKSSLYWNIVISNQRIWKLLLISCLINVQIYFVGFYFALLILFTS